MEYQVPCKITPDPPSDLAAGFGCADHLQLQLQLQLVHQEETTEMISKTHGHGAAQAERNSDGCEEKDKQYQDGKTQEGELQL
ncbi:hypothetical protein WN943_029115 [Citrus x changshan-huyou]